MAHKGARDNLTAEYVRRILEYEPETGDLKWKVSMSPRGRLGAIAGSRNGGRVKIGIAKDAADAYLNRAKTLHGDYHRP